MASLWKKILSKVSDLDKVKVKVGVIRGQGAEQAEANGATVALVALANEFGTEDGRVPERAPLRKTLREHRVELAEKRKAAARAVVSGGGDAKRELGKIGLWLASQIRATIRAGLTPPNAPSTIARKGSSTPLVDEGRLINSFTWAIVDGSERSE